MFWALGYCNDNMHILFLLNAYSYRSIDLCPASDSHSSLMKHLSDSLTRARDWLTSFDSSQTVTTGAETAGPVSASICRPNTRVVYPMGHAWDTSKPNSYPEPPNLTRRLSSAIMASTANFSDRLFCLSQIHLPNALECGLELFSIQSTLSSRQVCICVCVFTAYFRVISTRLITMVGLENGVGTSSFLTLH